MKWAASLQFRVNGPEGGDGNLHIWYEREGRMRVGTSSIYTIDKFDGLALVIDAYGGKGGSIRALLNDGSTDYKSVHNVDSLAFGHCDFQYRNLGRLVEVKLIQASDHLRLDVDGRQCFTSNTIKLPHDYYFGITAASASNPDSFEVFSFAVNSDVHISNDDNKGQQQTQDQTQTKQFAELNNKIDELTRMISRIQDQTLKLSQVSAESREELSKNRNSIDRLAQLNIKIETIERVAYAIKADIEGRDYRDHLSSLQQTVKDHHSSLMVHLPKTMGNIVASAAPRMSVIFLIVLLSQVILFVGYTVYRRRLKMQPKKYV
ncbi:hypothetical protein FGG08_005257 [Glutinoglossum americanum]|uniref:L-type lectin-like domain-containing protein n=1 Tax=Glutinoglossum americanum TaxID=1670608 RepID=A0A9P8I7M0_9PEZI|nr:hypothetical protein FGG08_005257 [Glutinoglossum americanum]